VEGADTIHKSIDFGAFPLFDCLKSLVPSDDSNSDTHTKGLNGKAFPQIQIHFRSNTHVWLSALFKIPHSTKLSAHHPT
jgi:hypothetical protein